MDKTNGDDSVLAFDTLFTTNHIQIMKTLLPYLDETRRKSFAVLIKFQELTYTMEYVKKHRIFFPGRRSEKQTADMQDIYPKIQGFLTAPEKSGAEQLINMMSALQSFGQMQEMMQMMNAMNQADGENDPSDMLMGMLSEEQRAMFEMFQNT